MSSPTLADVARAVGVSRTTVSNAYNRPDQLSPTLRDRILTAADQLGYPGPDPVARGLRRGRTGMVGVVYDQPLSYLFTDPAILETVAGMASVWDDVGVSLALLPRLHAGDPGAAVLANAAVDGFVSICDVAGDDRLAALAARRLPFVMLDGGGAGGRCHIGIDDRGASRAATRHLIELGHRRLAAIALPRSPGAPGGPVDPSRDGSLGRWRGPEDRLDRRPRQPRRHLARPGDQRQQRPAAVRVGDPLRDRGLPRHLAGPRARRRAGPRRLRDRCRGTLR